MRELILYIDYKSPFSYLAMDPARDLAAAHGARLVWRHYTFPIPDAFDGVEERVIAPGEYMFSDSGMIDDVQAWLDAPSTNFGWFVIGDESDFPTAKKFASRENGEAGWRPMLQVDFTPIPGPSGLMVGLAAAALGRRRRRRC